MKSADAQFEYPSPQLLDHITAQGIRAHMEFLADDLLEGRGIGTRGYQLAANYVRAEKQYLMEGNPAHEHASVEAALVFVGYGVTAPERHYDDYAGIDAKGKIVVVVTGAPPSFPASDRAMYSDDFVKSKNAASHGAIGAVGIWAGEVTKNTPWKQIIRLFHQPVMRWIDENGMPNDYVPELQVGAFVNQDGAEVLFASSGHTLSEVISSLEASKPLSFPLVGNASLSENAHYTNLENPNVAGVLRGSDPRLENEYVVFTAHADHIGIGEAINGAQSADGGLRTRITSTKSRLFDQVFLDVGCWR